MADCIYDRIKYVTFTMGDIGYVAEQVSSLSDKDDKIIMTTCVKLDGFKRGLIGDLSYTTTMGNDLFNENISHPYFTQCIKDVLLARVGCEADTHTGCVMWTYTFLKY